MRKMILLTAMVAIAALMMAATPAMAVDRNGDGFDDFVEEFCEDFDGDGIEDCEEFVEEFCEDFDGDFFCDDEEDNFCNFFDCRDNDNNNVPAVTQDFEQEAESGDIDQSFDVSNTGDNSNQTVGIQGVANTGNAQNQIGVVDAGGFGDFGGNDFNNEDDFCDEFDEFCEDLEEFCEDFDGDGFCDFFFDNGDDFFFDGDRDDEFFVFGNNDGGDFEFEDVGSTIEVSPTNTVNSSQQVNQAATTFGK
jgi:hypothetical protein